MSVEEEVRRRVMHVLAEEHGSGVRGAGMRGGVLMGGRYCSEREHVPRIRCKTWAKGQKPSGFVASGPAPAMRVPKGERHCVKPYQRGNKKGKCKLWAKGPRPSAEEEFLAERAMERDMAIQNLVVALKAAGTYIPGDELDQLLAEYGHGSGVMGGVAGGRRRPRLRPSMAKAMRHYPRGGVLLGGVRGKSKYITFLKKYAKQHGLSYREAMIQVKRKRLWKKARGGGVDDFY